MAKIGISRLDSSGGGHAKSYYVPFSYNSLISVENIFQAWEEFKKGKGQKRDVQIFERNLEDNLFNLHWQLKNKTYRHGGYQEFWVNDPKRRHIHKASVRDRIVHHLLYKYLYELFDNTFIYDSYSCRNGKGAHKAVKRLEEFSRVVSKNYSRNCWALKLDIKQFFASVDHKILRELIAEKAEDKEIVWLIENIIDSFNLGVQPLKGIPLGNLTSQVFANIYLNELDRFVKHKLSVKYYLRYADDFIILDSRRDKFFQYTCGLEEFLRENLKLRLHPNKIVMRKLRGGIDFCGYIVLPHYILPRTRTKRRIFRKVLSGNASTQSLQSYLGYLSHASTNGTSYDLKSLCFWLNEVG